jgi:glucose-fructose oxidoreductase
VQAAPGFALKAIYSRSLNSAQSLAEGTANVDLYSEDSGAGKSFDDLLARSDIGAVIIAYVELYKPPGYMNHLTYSGLRALLTTHSLPILVQPDFIKRALLSGKHVLSEKPIAKDVATAKELLQWYQANIDATKVFWAVGENFRYMSKYIYAAEQVQKLGHVRNFRVDVQNFVKPDNKYFCMSSPWMKKWQGAYSILEK